VIDGGVMDLNYLILWCNWL